LVGTDAELADAMIACVSVTTRGRWPSSARRPP